jgi:hypothetical protein
MREEQRQQREAARDREEPLSTRDVARGAAASPARDRSKQGENDRKPAENSAPLFNDEECDKLRSRWMSIQTKFVDEPRKSVEEADHLVAATIKRLAEIFAVERENLERELGRGKDVSTEDLRVALQRYRSFFDRLLSV